MRLGRGNTANRCGWLSKATVLARIFATLALTLTPIIGFAAPVVPLQQSAEAPGICGLEAVSAPDCQAPLLLPDPFGAERMWQLGGSLLGSAAAHVEAVELVAPIPLPAAAWLVLAGMGMLGIAARRRREALPTLRRCPVRPAADGADAGTDPLASCLRGSALSDTHRFFGSRLRPRRPGRFLREASLLSLRLWPQTAFPPGTASPAVPCGGSLHAYPPLSERAPPAGPAGWIASAAKLLSFSPSFRHAPVPLGPWRFAFATLETAQDFGNAGRDSGVGRKSKSGSNPPPDAVNTFSRVGQARGVQTEKEKGANVMSTLRKVLGFAAAAFLTSVSAANAVVSFEVRAADDTTVIGFGSFGNGGSGLSATGSGGFITIAGSSFQFPPEDNLFGTEVGIEADGTATYFVYVSDTGFGAPAGTPWNLRQTANTSDQNAAITVETYIDPGNALFALTTLLDGFTADFIPPGLTLSNDASGVLGNVAPYSVTHRFQVSHNGAIVANASADYSAIPLPAALPLLLGGLGALGFAARRRRVAA